MSLTVIEQTTFRPPLPLVHGCKDYREQRQLFERVDAILEQSGADQRFIELSLQNAQARDRDEQTFDETELDAEEQAETGQDPPPDIPLTSDGNVHPNWVRHTRGALRVNIARILLGFSLRMMSLHLADSALLRWFCGIGDFGPQHPPAKSTIHRYTNWVDPEYLQPLLEEIIQQAGGQIPTRAEFIEEEENTPSADSAPLGTQPAAHPLGLENPVDLTEGWLDPTCVKANIHYPTDWVLLRDGARTLTKAIELIRKRGLRARMPYAPDKFMSEMNKLTIEMSQTRRRKDGKKARKRVLRQMDKHLKKIRSHAKRHRDLLEQRWSETDLSEPQAAQIIRRIDGILELLPKAVKQARERIIGERQVKSDEKLLSLYETELNVVVRGKADAEVEFGNTLWLTEQREGLIVDWKLHEGPVSDNSAEPFADAVDRLTKVTGKQLDALWADRGLDTKKNAQVLSKHEVKNGLMPKNPAAMSEKMDEEDFAAGQRRRASTEGRIGLFKNRFLGRPLRAKGFKNRQIAVGWAVFTHDLWVLARLPQAAEAEEQLAAAA